MTNTTHPARVAPAAEAPLTEQISALVSEETRAYLLGTVELEGARSEGVVVRALLLMTIESLKLADPAGYRERLRLGEMLISERRAARADAVARAKR